MQPNRRDHAWLALCAVLALVAPSPSAATAKGSMSEATPTAANPGRCDIRVAAGGTALADAVSKAPTGARLCLAAGTHSGGVVLDKSLTLVADGGEAIVVGTPRMSALRVEDDGLAIALEGLTLSGGTADAGGGLAVFGRGKVRVVNCTFRHNHAGMLGGGGLYARSGLVEVSGTTFASNEGRQGGAVMLDQAVRAEFSRCTFTGNRGEMGGALRVVEGAQVVLKASTFRDNAANDGAAWRVSATRSRKPEIKVDHCTIDDALLVNGPDIPGEIEFKGTRAPASWKSVVGVKDGGGNTWR